MACCFVCPCVWCLPDQAVKLIEKLISLACGSEYLFPARKQQTRMLPHIAADTVNSAIGRFIKPEMAMRSQDWTPHDMRRTGRTYLAQLGVSSTVAEKCLNHQLPGMAEVYDRHAYFEERKEALQSLADFYTGLGLKV